MIENARIQIDTSDEFGALARQFNSMTQALKEQQQQLVQHERLEQEVFARGTSAGQHSAAQHAGPARL